MKHELSTMQTKLALSDSLKRLMKKKPLSKISISDIISDTKFNRKTFYYHFSDINELLGWSFSRDTAEIVKQFDSAIDFPETIMFLMDYAESNHHIISSALDDVGSDVLAKFFYNDLFSIVSGFLESAQKRENIALEESYKKFLCDFYCNAISLTLLDWFKSKEKENKEVVCDRIFKTLSNSIKGILSSRKTGDSRIAPTGCCGQLL